jgi:polysaccharide pyruvyl transferase WcaK-like protein
MKIAVYLITDPNNIGDYLQQFLTAKLLSMHYAGSELYWMINSLKPLDTGGFPMKKQWDMGYFAKYDVGVIGGHSAGLATRRAWKRVYPLVCRSSRKSMIFPITVSSKTDENVRSELKKLLSKFSKVYARGNLTYDFLHRELGLENVDLALDTGFALRILYPEVRAQDNHGNLKIAVVPRKEMAKTTPERYMRYLKRLKESIDFLTKKYNAQVDLLPFSHGYDNSDEAAAGDLYHSGAAIKNIVKLFEYPIYETYKILSQYDYVITSRMHAGIMAMSAGVPCVMLFSRKTQKVIDVLDSLGLDKKLFMLPPVSERLVKRLERNVENLQELRQMTDNAVSQKCKESLKPLEFQLVE